MKYTKYIVLTVVLILAFQSPLQAYTLDRTLRYHPQGESFVIHNGNIKFNRALYGNNSAFRVETGDVPELAMYMPGMGGNIHFGLVVGNKTLWLNDADSIEAVYTPGKRSYIIKDKLLQGGKLELEVLACYSKDGFIAKWTTYNVRDVQLVWVFGGATANSFSRNGDLNVDPPDCFDLKPNYCKNNVYEINNNTFRLQYGQESKRGSQTLYGVFPEMSMLHVGDASLQSSLLEVLHAKTSDSSPMLVGTLKLNGDASFYMSIYNPTLEDTVRNNNLKREYAAAEQSRLLLAHRITIKTPDPFINTLGGVVAMAGDAIWDGTSYQHGAIGWRIPLNGWRGAYVADVLGWHDRAEKHFSAYASSQITEPLDGPVVMDTALHLARGQEKLGNRMYSSGYICRNPNGKFQPHHYDMNLCFIDELLWHFNWTGDLSYVKKMWPTLQRHLKWEKRNFDPDNDGLYDAYACIWASDALQYNSGGVTHSSAYNYKANKLAAEIASKLGEDATPYIVESQKIKKAIGSQLWMKNKGWWAEYKDYFGDKQLHPSAALWTIYHAIDSDVPNSFEAYQALRYVDTEIPHIPIVAKGIDSGYSVVSTTSWMPYSWSINNVALAEIHHTALAYWQGGCKNQAFNLWKSGVLDAMYLGSSPGNVGQISYYDAARGETYRDFADPIGIFARSMVQGLFGILPDALNDQVVIRPGWPSQWKFVNFKTPDVEIDYKQITSNVEEYHFSLTLPHQNKLVLKLPARKDHIKSIMLNGEKIAWVPIDSSIDIPEVKIDCGKAKTYSLRVEWYGNTFTSAKEHVVALHEPFIWNTSYEILGVYDPQSILGNHTFTTHSLHATLTGEEGYRTAFIQVKQGNFTYWKALKLNIRDSFTLCPNLTDSENLNVRIQNNTQKVQQCIVHVENFSVPVTLPAQSTSSAITIPSGYTVAGTNAIQVENRITGDVQKCTIIDWGIAPSTSALRYKSVKVDQLYNAKMSDIFKNKYLTPRSPYVTLQIPWQGIGEWCHPLLTANIDEKGLLGKAAANDGKFILPNGIPFWMATDSSKSNIIYTSLWNNYPDSVIIPLSGKSSHAYFLMAGSTNHMQSQFQNGFIEVSYTDGTCERLTLINPENWCPIEQDYYEDGLAFCLKTSRPWRIALKTGLAFRNGDKALGLHGVYTRQIDGGAATVLDLPLDNHKTLEKLVLRTTAYDVVIGIASITLVQ